MQPLVPLVFHNLPSLYPPSFRRNDFYTCIIENSSLVDSPSASVQFHNNRHLGGDIPKMHLMV